MLIALLAVLAAGSPLYVTATSLNVRSEPKASSKLVYVARIAEACTAKGPAVKGWLELDCGAFHGFAKADFLSPVKPTLEALQKHFDELEGKDDREDWEERFTTAQRLIALGAPGGDYARFVRSFFDAENAKLYAEDAKPVEAIEPKISRQSQDAVSEGELYIASELGLPQVSKSLRGKVLPDGTAWFYAGEWSPGAQWLSNYQFHAVVSPAFAQALGAKIQADACPFLAPADAPLLCAAPAGKTCTSLAACHTCKVQCAASCNDCRLGCKRVSKRKQKDMTADGPWEACVKACLPTYGTCAAACDAAAEPSCK